MFKESQNPAHAWRWGNPYRDTSPMATNRPCWKCGQHVPHHYLNGHWNEDERYMQYMEEGRFA